MCDQVFQRPCSVPVKKSDSRWDSGELQLMYHLCTYIVPSILKGLQNRNHFHKDA